MKTLDFMTAFNSISKSQWLEKIQKDLKGSSLTDFEWKLADDLHFDPFVHASDLKHSEVNFLALDRVASKIPLAVINAEEVGKANKEALSQLQQGAGSIFFKIKTESTELLYADIIMDMVETIDQANIVTIQNIPDDFVQWRSEILKSCHSALKSNVIPGSLALTLGRNLFLNICIVRASRMVFQQLAHDLGQIETPLKIIAIYDLNDSIDLEENLQLSMPKVFAAYVGGADHIGPSDIRNTEDSKWYHNLVHLLSHESGIPLNEDTLSGSFLIESLTNKIADNIWNHLLNIETKK